MGQSPHRLARSFDGKLTREEVADERLHRRFDMADANKDGVVTREDLVALAAKLDAQGGPGGRGKGKGKDGPRDGLTRQRAGTTIVAVRLQVSEPTAARPST